MSSAGDGSHERNRPWTRDQTGCPLMFHLLSCHFTLKAKRSEYEATTPPSYSKLSFPPASLNRLSLTPRAPAAHVLENKKRQNAERESTSWAFSPPAFFHVTPFRMHHQRPELHSIISSISLDYSVQTSSKRRRQEQQIRKGKKAETAACNKQEVKRRREKLRRTISITVGKTVKVVALSRPHYHELYSRHPTATTGIEIQTH